MKKYLCIHLHFYQPPRENPWLEDIVLQESAYPFHNWNERITSECYRANAESRIKDRDNYVVNVVNNYTKISFNFGPTLLSWLEEKDPTTYEGILTGDRISQQKFGGHGSAIAQAYNHSILPLSNRRDKETQIKWGIRDFEKRFGRYPEGLWLPETAVDIDSLEILSAHGIKFVILAPHQAKAVRDLKNGNGEWRDLNHRGIDPSQAYEISLPSGRSIAGFFYDGPISQAVAFEGLLHNGEAFAKRLLEGYDSNRNNKTQLLHIATDGETYGHHHRFGDMALAYALDILEKENLVQVCNYGQFLELYPPTQQVQIFENSSWSCMHGIERWRSDCGCNSGQHAGWHQIWRAPLRHALDETRDLIEKPFEAKLKNFCPKPWQMRNDYINVILDRSDSSFRDFLKRNACQDGLNESNEELILKLMEMQRHLLLMYTSCAWFFDEISGIETVQTLQYAYRAIELAEETLGLKLIDRFKDLLLKAPSNNKETKNGAEVFERFVLPARVDFLTLGIHFAISSLFTDYEKEERIYSYYVSILNHEKKELGKAKIAYGQAKVRSIITREQKHLLYGALHFGDHNVNAGAKLNFSQTEYHQLQHDLTTAFSRADFVAILHSLTRYFPQPLHSLKDLFKDEQKKIIDQILGENLNEVEENLIQIYEKNYPLASYLSGLSIRLPVVFRHIAEFVQNRGIQNALAIAPDYIEVNTIKKHLDEAKTWGIKMDYAGINHLWEDVLPLMFEKLKDNFSDISRIEHFIKLTKLALEPSFVIDWGRLQNMFFIWMNSQFYRQLKESHLSNETSNKILQMYSQLASLLRVRISIGSESFQG